MKTINMLALLLGILLIPGQVFSQFDAVQEVAPVDVATVLAEGALFLDVRETNEVEVLAYDLPDVMNLPLSELPDRLDELPRDRPIIVACRSGKRSTKAVALLSENDLTQLFHLTGGMIEWQAASLPVNETKRAAKTTSASPKQCCASKGAGKANEKSCCAKKTDAEPAKESCNRSEERRVGERV